MSVQKLAAIDCPTSPQVKNGNIAGTLDCFPPRVQQDVQ
jgi:hypothetical protein